MRPSLVGIASLLAQLLVGCGPDVSITRRDVDADGDGYLAEVDCDDTHATVNPDASEVCDGLDNDCDLVVDDEPTDGSTWYADADGDGAGDPEASVDACAAPEGAVADASDCDDTEGRVYPGNAELCDGIDNNCDGEVDEDTAEDAPTWFADVDGDGWGDPALSLVGCEAPDGHVAPGSDCDDTDASVHPEAAEDDCTDPTDYNCDGSVGWADADGDGAAACSDCDDTDATRSPAWAEVCDEADVDEDCSGAADDADPGVTGAPTWYRDVDGDGYAPAAAVSAIQCEEPAGYASVDGDCDDYDSAISPVGTEVCDAAGTDEDCDGLADDADPSVDAATWTTLYRDADGDGFGDAARSLAQCEAVSGYVTSDEDCDDADADVSPAEAEVCDAANVDEDCDGVADDADASVEGGSAWYPDADGDTWGAPSGARTACEPPSGHVATSSDCDDATAIVNPGAVEVCDDADVDEDCDGFADDGDPSATGKGTVYADRDGDGYGGPSSAAFCDLPAGYESAATDCDDTRASVSPSATEACTTAYDDDCDGAVNEAGASDCTIWHQDGDADGHGASSWVCACAATGSYTAANADDCDDTRASVSPDAAEACATAYDDDCDGVTNEAGARDCVIWYLDGDADGHGTAASVCACAATGTYTASNADDCDDVDGAVHPAAPEVCEDDVDDDCDGDADDGCPVTLTGDHTMGDIAGDELASIGGDTANEGFGAGLVAADLDGDGDEELLISSNGARYGAAYGSVYRFDGPLGSTGLDAATAADARIYGSTTLTGFGGTLHDLGDLDGDGVIEVTARHRDGTTQTFFVYEGEDIAGVAPYTDAAWTFPDYGIRGRGSAAGDTNGDGVNEYLLGNVETSGFRGSAVLYSGTTVLASYIGEGSSSSYFGAQVAGGAGNDFDGDGLDDVVITAPNYGSQVGRAYIFHGPLTGSEASAATADITINGASAADLLGYGVNLPGDLDGDGTPDLILGAPYTDHSGSTSGTVYVLTDLTSDTGVGTADAVFHGGAAGDFLGYWAHQMASGDADGDGVTDVLFGTSTYDPGGLSGGGGAWLYLGPFAGTYTADTDHDARFVGDDASDGCGAVAIFGDLDGNGADEVILSCFRGELGAVAETGAVYVFGAE